MEGDLERDAEPVADVEVTEENDSDENDDDDDAEAVDHETTESDYAGNEVTTPTTERHAQLVNRIETNVAFERQLSRLVERAMLARRRDTEARVVDVDDDPTRDDPRLLSGFDRAIPTLHSYLGEVGDARGGAGAHADLQRLANGDLFCKVSTTHTEVCRSTTITIPLFWFPDYVLFPGDALPLWLGAHRARDAIARSAVETAAAAPFPLKGFFGVVCVSAWVNADPPTADLRRSRRPERPMVGTLAEIRRIGMGDDGQTRLVARGRARFAVKHPRRVLEAYDPADDEHGVLAAVEVELLSDTADRPNLNRAFGGGGDLGGSSRRWRPLTPHSKATYDLFDPHALAKRLRDSPGLRAFLGLNAHTEDAKHARHPITLPLDPALFSHSVASKAPLSIAARYELLRAATTADRLREELKLLDRFRSFPKRIFLKCSSCDAKVSTLLDLLVMSDDGASGAYCNPTGAVYDVLTVKSVSRNAVRLRGEPSSEFSWFPGFQWTVACCARCRQHLGWQFTPETGPPPTTTTTTAGPTTTRPSPAIRFFGFTRSRIRASGFQKWGSDALDPQTPFVQ